MSQNLNQPEKLRVNLEELEDIAYSYGGYDTLHYNGKPFSGYAVMDFYSNGNVCFEEEYKDGEHESWDNKYYENGILQEKSLMTGATPLETYYYDQNRVEIKHSIHVPLEELHRLIEKYNLKD